MQDRPDDRKKGVRLVKLAGYRDRVEKIERREMTAAFLVAAKRLAERKDVEGYAIVTYTKDTIESLVNYGDVDMDLFWAKINRQLKAAQAEAEAVEESEANS